MTIFPAPGPDRPAAAQTRYARFVALGDSQTEGLWDGDDDSGLRGWADRFAERLAQDNPGILYANLAVRGRRLAEIRDEQLDAALAMRPDVVGFCAGMNDVTAPGGDFATALDVMEELYAKLTACGATVVTTTFPDARRIVPLAARLIGPRMDLINDRIRLCATRYDLRLVDLYSAPSMADLRMWSPDRLHGSQLGHERFALAAAEAMRLDGADHSWAHPPQHSERFRAGSTLGELGWMVATVRPWLWRRVRGVSTGHGRAARRAELGPVTIDATP
ncbi:SGNH/GDSL hydrolase family protein [Nocardia spumae]|uniref:SGNH/GDSL hydrolase family protein n=1 Tax=Nocardia spumae TaxID=2887190 RepID=UPI001D13B3A9|nr:SGNH/GDSL hydrolase family protein [Nocardia spumae]